jgi:glutamyl/glutaminyl-tRNA synthetase
MPVTRFAPAPTGALHLGHVANAIYVWGLAARHGARVLLRIEDHDRQRSRPEYETALLDDLDWLGFVADEFARQSDREAAYRDVAKHLHEQGRLYACTCSRKTACECRSRRITLADGVAWRLRIDADADETFTDLLRGPTTQTVSGLSDPVIHDRHGNWTYQFAVVVDDHQQGVDLVIRGEDLLPSTGLQVWMGRLIGREAAATFAHHPLIMKSPTQKLSKSDRDTGIRDLRLAGMSAEDVIALAARQLCRSVRL